MLCWVIVLCVVFSIAFSLLWSQVYFKLIILIPVFLRLCERWAAIKSNQHDGKPWTQKLSSGCPSHVGCLTRHYNVQREASATIDDQMAEVDNKNEVEKEDKIPELEFTNSKFNLMDVKLRAPKNSGLCSAFRKKSRLAKHKLKDQGFS